MHTNHKESSSIKLCKLETYNFMLFDGVYRSYGMYLTGSTPMYSKDPASTMACRKASLYDRYSNGPACKMSVCVVTT